MSIEAVIDSYNTIDEENRLKSTNARKVEFLTTIDAIGSLVKKNMRLLDCGCGVGIYSMYCAKIGAYVTALDLVPKHIEKLKAVAYAENTNIDIRLGNAIDLSAFEEESFDITLCMGPLYHLLDKKDQESCINECIRVTKKGGYIVFSYISPFSVFPCVIRGDQSRISEQLARKIICEKQISSSDDLCFWTDNYYYSPDEIETVMVGHGLTIEDHLATDGQSIAFQNVINALNDAQFAIWMKYHRLVCREKSIIGASNHGLIIVRREAKDVSAT